MDATTAEKDICVALEKQLGIYVRALLLVQSFHLRSSRGEHAGEALSETLDLLKTVSGIEDRIAATLATDDRALTGSSERTQSLVQRVRSAIERLMHGVAEAEIIAQAQLGRLDEEIEISLRALKMHRAYSCLNRLT
jgi:hypothetical protein